MKSHVSFQQLVGDTVLQTTTQLTSWQGVSQPHSFRVPLLATWTYMVTCRRYVACVGTEHCPIGWSTRRDSQHTQRQGDTWTGASWTSWYHRWRAKDKQSHWSYPTQHDEQIATCNGTCASSCSQCWTPVRSKNGALYCRRVKGSWD